MRKPAFCIWENKGADSAADQRLCFRCVDSTVPLLPKTTFRASSLLLWLYSPISVGPGRKTPKTRFLMTQLIVADTFIRHCASENVSRIGITNQNCVTVCQRIIYFIYVKVYKIYFQFELLRGLRTFLRAE